MARKKKAKRGRPAKGKAKRKYTRRKKTGARAASTKRKYARKQNSLENVDTRDLLNHMIERVQADIAERTQEFTTAAISGGIESVELALKEAAKLAQGDEGTNQLIAFRSNLQNALGSLDVLEGVTEPKRGRKKAVAEEEGSEEGTEEVSNVAEIRPKKKKAKGAKKAAATRKKKAVNED